METAVVATNIQRTLVKELSKHDAAWKNFTTVDSNECV